MGVKGLWECILGPYTKQKRVNIVDVIQAEGRVAVDLSSWVHSCDCREEAQLSRTSKPTYPSMEVIRTFKERHTVLLAMGLTPTYVFDGKGTNMKEDEIASRNKAATNAAEEFNNLLNNNLPPLSKMRDGLMGRHVTDELYQKLQKSRKCSAKPTPHDYAQIAQYCEENNISVVGSLFEADAQMVYLEKRGYVDMVMSDDGDLIIIGVCCLLSDIKFDFDNPKKSTCRLYDRSSNYQFIAKWGKIMAEVSCLLGNDYIHRVRGNGPATLFEGKQNQKAVAMSLLDAESTESWVSSDELDNEGIIPEGWGKKFMAASRLIRHYPVISISENGESASIIPINPLPEGKTMDEWGAFIGFPKNPTDYFREDSVMDIYTVHLMASTMKERSSLLGPRDGDNILLPPFSHLNFTCIPIEAEHVFCLKNWLIHRGVIPEPGASRTRMSSLVRRSMAMKKPVLPPSLRVNPLVKWNSIEALKPRPANDPFDDWNSEFLEKVRMVRAVDDYFFDHHFGAEAQSVMERGLSLLTSGHLDITSISVLNVSSDLKQGVPLFVLKSNCLSSERSVVHKVYVVFENKIDGDFLPSPCSICSCEDGMLFCSHTICMLLLFRIIQTHPFLDKDGLIKRLPDDPKVLSAVPMLIENLIALDTYRRSRKRGLAND